MNLIYLPLTILIYLGAVKLQRRWPQPLFNPVLLTLISLVSLLLASGISYGDYDEYNHYLTNLLQPAVVALGVPLYQQLHLIRQELPRIAIVVLISVIVAITSSVLLALLIDMTPDIASSLAPKSVTTPIAILIVQKIGGHAALAAIAVIVTGLVGSVIGLSWMRLSGIHSPKAQGIAMGTACHALGTARISEEGAQQGAYSAFAMVLSATFSALLAPFIVPWLLSYI